MPRASLAFKKSLRILALTASMAALSACGGSSGGSAPTATAPTPPPVTISPADAIFATQESTARFFSQATFGASKADLDRFTGRTASAWFRAELSKPASLNLPYVQSFLSQPEAQDDNGRSNYYGNQSPGMSFWVNAIEGDDQLRQRMAYALSQIFVISHSENSSSLFDRPVMVADYQDILTENAFGNFRNLLGDVTYSPAMGLYLTYWQNQKGDPDTDRMPDENYAREIMQLFSIGLVELNPDGSIKTDGAGTPIETYDNDDVTGLARVFTGLSLNADRWWRGLNSNNLAPDAYYSPMIVFDDIHESGEKTFLGTTISAGTPGEQSIEQALDTLFAHPNVGPFFSRQLIQRFTVSAPRPEYVARVSAAFEAGQYTLPDGSRVGTGERGDLSATLAAVLMDQDVRSPAALTRDDGGKVREPILRFTQWARTFNAGEITPQHSGSLWNTGSADTLSQHPYKSPSVFNFYRPGYIAPGSVSGGSGQTAPELQIVNASTSVGYANFMSYYIFGLNAVFGGSDEQKASFIADYSFERTLVETPQALVDHLNQVLTAGTLSAQTAANIVDAINAIPMNNEFDEEYDGPGLRVGTAILMVMTSPDYLVQR